ncbi:hypothetical protein [Paenibacillus sp. GYB003]|uniref:hypothetical protein n=1 Tax=Paenibacillus sp. GYB003 TaxID=2994392 RepID=UPI002F963044
MPRTNPKYKEAQMTQYRKPDEKILGKISKLYDGECIGYYKTTWLVYLAIVRIGERFEFCWMDDGYISTDGPKSWGAQKVDYFRKIGKGWDLYFEHVWFWISPEAISEYFDWVFSQEGLIYVEESKKVEPIPVDPPKVRTPKTRSKSNPRDDGQLYMFEVG